MNFIKNCRSKYHIKRILVPLLLAAIVATIVLEMGVLLPEQVPSFNLASVDILKISAPDPLEPPQECLDKPDGYNKWSCLKPYFERITIEVSSRAAIAEAKSLKRQGVIGDCHVISHFIGWTNLEKYNFNMVQAFTSCASGCVEGCFHGVMDRSIWKATDPHNIISNIKNVCDNLGTSPVNKYRCIHGVGHGLRAHGYLSIKDALTACDDALESDFWIYICAGGIFMENMDQYIALDLDEDHLRKILPEICAPFESLEPDLVAMPEEFPDIIDGCIYGITNGLMDYTGHDIERTEDLCEELPRQKYIDYCKNYIPIVLGDVGKFSEIETFFENREVF